MATPAVTDYHVQTRDAIRDALGALQLSVRVVALEDPETDLVNVNLPAVVVACIGPEQDRAEMGTNRRDGIGYTSAVMLMANSVTSGAKTPGVLTPTEFRRLVRTTFHQKRLSAVAEVGWCETSELGPLYDKDSPAFQKLQAGLAVTAVGRFPRS
jgi:hypothetical protein